jgi:hypothetical protein
MSGWMKALDEDGRGVRGTIPSYTSNASASDAGILG